MPPNTVAPVTLDHNIFPVMASMAYIGPVLYVDPANTTPLATVIGPLAWVSLGTVVDQRVWPVRAFIATHPLPVVVVLEGARVKS